MSKTKVYTNTSNGYSAVLYGKSSMIVITPEGKEVLHTGNRNVNTEDEVMKILENFPQFLKEIDEK